MSASTPLPPLRVVTFNVLPPAFGVVRQWAERPLMTALHYRLPTAGCG